jgi:Ca2+-transporting ATPase
MELEAKTWHALTVDEALKTLDVVPSQGLTADEAGRRLVQYGPNELKSEERISALAIFLGQFKNTLIVILMVAIVLSAVVGEVVDAIIIGVIVLFCGVLGFVQEYRAEKAMDALKKMLAPTITALRDGRETVIASRDVVPGDILLVAAGDRIPADGRVIESHSLRADEAPLTGESVPVSKKTDPLAAETRIDSMKNMIFTGTTITYGRGRALVTSTGMTTAFGRIAEKVSAIETEKTPLEKRTEEIGKWLGISALAICGLVAGVTMIREAVTGSITMPHVVTTIMFAIALAVAAVPEALAAIVTGALAIGMREMAKNNALVRRMPAVETLGCTTVICSDKTGTLTRGEMTIRRVFLGDQMIDVGGVGYLPEGGFSVIAGSGGPAAETPAFQTLMKTGVLCSDAELEHTADQWRIKGDPTEGALVVLAAKAGLNARDLRRETPRIEEIPFSSERKRMTTIHRLADGILTACMKGAPEIVLDRCRYKTWGGGQKDLTPEDRARILEVNESLAQEGLRVLALAGREVTAGEEMTEDGLERDMVFYGLAGMMDPPRPEAIEAIRVCKKVRIKPVMITGDHKLTAMAVAAEIGIYQPGDRALTGPELEKMPDEEFEKIVQDVTVYARVSPMDKLKIVKAWKKRGEIVAMTGDGVNDAPALKHADIGVAMGITGTEVAKEAADMILTDDNFASTVKAIEQGRWIYDNIKKYLTYLLRCNITEVVVIGGVVLIMGPEYLPLLPAAILYINLATDGLPALALGVAPPDPDIMERPPRDPKESVFSPDVRAFLLLAVLLEIPFFFYLFFQKAGDIQAARTDVFFLFIVIELIIALNLRSMTYSIFKAPPHKWLILALIWEVALMMVLLQFATVREAFGIHLPPLEDLGIILGFGVVVAMSMEGVKWYLRRKNQAGPV